MNARNLYLENQVKSATPMGLIVLLYDGLLRFASSASDQLEKQTDQGQEAAAASIERCTKILTELNTSLNADASPDLASHLSNLYRFFMEELNQALIEKKHTRIQNIIPLISDLRDSWKNAEFKIQNDRTTAPETAET